MTTASDEVKAYLEGVVGVVEANTFETMCLWQNYSQEQKKTWVSTGHGYGPRVGSLADMPVHLSILTATVDGCKILFIEPISQVVDHRLIEAWLKENLPKSAFRGNGYLNKADAMNFGNALATAKDSTRSAT